MNNRTIEWDVQWFDSNFDKYATMREVMESYNKDHGTNHPYKTVVGFLNRNGFRKCNLSKEQDEFLRENYPKYGGKKTTALFNEKFNTNKTWSQIRSLCHNRGLRIEDKDIRNQCSHTRGCKYEIGETSKGGCEEYVKVSDTKWIRACVHIYEQVYGNIPDGYIVIHLDGDKSNNDPNNLEAIPRRFGAKMMRNKLWTHNAVLTKGVIALFELQDKLKEMERYGRNYLDEADNAKSDD